MSVLDCLRSTPPHYRISIEDAIREASPDYADETIERSKDHLENLKKLRLLRKYPHLNDAKALAIIAYMLDLGMTYEHSIYYKLRDALREGDEGAIRTVKGCLLHLLAALRSINPVSNDKPLYRVIDGKTYNLDKYHVGNRVSWPAFTTTVRDISVARKNIRGKGQPIFFEIRGSYRGYYLKDFSVSMDEDVILEPDTTVVVKEINPANKGHGNIITFVLEVVSSPPVLSEVVRNFNAANHPDTTLVADVQSVPEGWEARVDEKSGQYYYANLVTKTTQWEFPKEPVALNSSHEFSSVTVSNDRFSSCVEFDEKFSSLDEAKKIFESLASEPITLKEALDEAGLGFFYNDAKEKGEKVIELPNIARFGLTPDEAGAISCYTLQAEKDSGKKSPYNVLNESLAKNRDSDKLSSMKKYIFLLLRGLRKLEPFVPKNNALYRGMGKFVPLTFEEANGHQYYAEGQTVTWWGFTSTTLSFEVANSFVQKSNVKTYFEIVGPNRWGYDLHLFSAYPQEAEILLEPEAKIKVRNVANLGTDLLIKAELVPFDHLALESIIPVQNPMYLRPACMNQGGSFISPSGSGFHQGYQIPQGIPQMGQVNQMNPQMNPQWNQGGFPQMNQMNQMSPQMGQGGFPQMNQMNQGGFDCQNQGGFPQMNQMNQGGFDCQSQGIQQYMQQHPIYQQQVQPPSQFSVPPLPPQPPQQQLLSLPNQPPHQQTPPFQLQSQTYQSFSPPPQIMLPQPQGQSFMTGCSTPPQVPLRSQQIPLTGNSWNQEQLMNIQQMDIDSLTRYSWNSNTWSVCYKMLENCPQKRAFLISLASRYTVDFIHYGNPVMQSQPFGNEQRVSVRHSYKPKSARAYMVTQDISLRHPEENITKMAFQDKVIATGGSTEVFFVNADVLDIAEQLLCRGTPSKKVLAVNPCNTTNHGGKWLSGGCGQEENFMIRSELCAALGEFCYPLHERMLILATDVGVVRGPLDAGYPFLDPANGTWRVDVASVPQCGAPATASLGEQVFSLQTRLEMILRAALEFGYRVVVLPVFGGMASPRDAAIVTASVFNVFSGCFERIYIAASGAYYPLDIINSFAQVLTPDAKPDAWNSMVQDIQQYTPQVYFPVSPPKPYLCLNIEAQPCIYWEKCKDMSDEHRANYTHPKPCFCGQSCSIKEPVHLAMYMHPTIPDGSTSSSIEVSIASNTASPANLTENFQANVKLNGNSCSDSNSSIAVNASANSSSNSEELALSLPAYQDCENPFDCIKANDPRETDHSSHIRQYSHVCKFGGDCRDLDSPEHKNSFHHMKKDPCPGGAECANLTDPVHRFAFAHKGLWDFLIPCKHGQKCWKINDPDHCIKYFHGGFSFPPLSSIKLIN